MKSLILSIVILSGGIMPSVKAEMVYGCLSSHEASLVHLLLPHEQIGLLNPNTCSDVAEGIDFGALEDLTNNN